MDGCSIITDKVITTKLPLPILFIFFLNLGEHAAYLQALVLQCLIVWFWAHKQLWLFQSTKCVISTLDSCIVFLKRRHQVQFMILLMK